MGYVPQHNQPELEFGDEVAACNESSPKTYRPTRVISNTHWNGVYDGDDHVERLPKQRYRNGNRN